MVMTGISIAASNEREVLQAAIVLNVVYNYETVCRGHAQPDIPIR